MKNLPFKIDNGMIKENRDFSETDLFYKGDFSYETYLHTAFTYF